MKAVYYIDLGYLEPIPAERLIERVRSLLSSNPNPSKQPSSQRNSRS